jgi:hypothetical protein
MNAYQIAEYVIRWWEVRATDMGEIDAGDLVDHYLATSRWPAGSFVLGGDVSEIVEEVVRRNGGEQWFRA